jgi:hypothetical protein
MVYKRPQHKLFCPRCDRDYDPTTGEQIANFAWKRAQDGRFEPTYPLHAYALINPEPETDKT